MSKSVVSQSVAPSARLSPAGELRVLKKVAAELRKNPSALRQMTMAAGIYTKDGRLRKAYGGTAR